MNIVAFCGGMGAGKDTYGKVFAEINEAYVDTVHISFAYTLKEEADEIIKDLRVLKEKDLCIKHNLTKEEYNVLKDIAKSFTESTRAKDRTKDTRRFLQYLGTDIRRNKDNQYWVNKTKERLLRHSNSLAYITDARFENEFEFVRGCGGMLVLLEAGTKERIRRIQERDGITPTKEALHHTSEKGIYHFNDYDVIINTENVKEKDIKNILKEIIKHYSSTKICVVRSDRAYITKDLKRIPSFTAKNEAEYYIVTEKDIKHIVNNLEFSVSKEEKEKIYGNIIFV